MELKELVGDHTLSGVDTGILRSSHYGEDLVAQQLIFLLDGLAYQASEDPEDGYRSSMKELVVVEASRVANVFAPVAVRGVYLTVDPSGQECAVLQFLDGVTGLVVLEVGTYATDDYYPYFVGKFTPEHLAVNATQS